MVRRLSITVALCVTVALVLFALYWLGVWIPNDPPHAEYPVRGIDVSHHQREIRWELVKASGIHFAYIKATEGADFKDASFVENWSGSAAAAIAHGAYHFFILGSPGHLQALNFIATVPTEPNALPPAIDLEISGYNVGRAQSTNDFAKELSVFFDAVSAHYGKSPVIYTTHNFHKRYLRRMSPDRLWIREVITKPRQKWVFWQFSARGRVSGIPAFVDLNIFNGNELQFGDFLKTIDEAQ